MTDIYQNFIGIDIAKADFVVADNNSNEINEFTNNMSGFKKLLKSYQADLAHSLVVLETTGGYENDLLKYLLGNGIHVHRADTRKVKNFIRSLGHQAKTDAIDAKGLALYGLERHQRLALHTLPTEAEENLKAMTQRRGDLKRMLVQEKNRLQAPLSTPIVKTIKPIIKSIEKQIEILTHQISDLVAQDTLLVEKKSELMSIPGIGEISANSLLSLLPELGKLDNKKIASLCGVAPHPKQSGSKTWYSRTVGGRREVRQYLFMSAMAASRSKGHLGQFYRRLIESGKKPIVAITALMRKIVVIANSKLRDLNLKQNHQPA